MRYEARDHCTGHKIGMRNTQEMSRENVGGRARSDRRGSRWERETLVFNVHVLRVPTGYRRVFLEQRAVILASRARTLLASQMVFGHFENALRLSVVASRNERRGVTTTSRSRRRAAGADIPKACARVGLGPLNH
jgi:hypothetical protein